MAIRIDVVDMRDPDGYDDPSFYIDGEPSHKKREVAEIHVWGVDAGAGHDFAEWVDQARGVKQSAPPAVWEELEGMYTEPAGKQYIDGFPYDEGDPFWGWENHLDDSVEEFNAWWDAEAAKERAYF